MAEVPDRRDATRWRKATGRICDQMVHLAPLLVAPCSKYDYILSIVEQPCKPPVRPAAPAPKASHYSEVCAALHANPCCIESADAQ